MPGLINRLIARQKFHNVVEVLLRVEFSFLEEFDRLLRLV